MDVEVDIDELYRMEGPNHYLSLATVRISSRKPERECK
jgi:hypothetical protein